MAEADEREAAVAGVPLGELAQAAPWELKSAFGAAAAVARRAAGNFYYAFIFLPVDQRRGVEALYAFCRAGDDLADQGLRGSGKLLQALHTRLDICYQGRYCDRLTLALADAVRHFALERRHFEDLLLGLTSDLKVQRYSTFDELRLYCYRVASTVGLLCIQIFGCDTPECRRYAEKLGIGMQLTNILRDLFEDYQRGRIYLPLEDLRRFGLEENGLFAPENREQLRELVRWEAGRAEGFFAAADEELNQELKGRLFAAGIMGAIYRQILSLIAAAERFDRRIELGRREKMRIARRLFNESGSAGK